MRKKRLTKQERELIEAIRNLQSAFPNGYYELKYYAQQLFDEMVDLPKDK